MAVLRRGAGLLAAWVITALTARASADCTPPGRESACLNADELWVPAAPTNFVAIPAAQAPAAHAWSLGLATTYLSRPIVLTATSPSPGGRDVRVVDDVVDAALSGSYAPAPHLELSFVVPFAAYRTGTGLTGVSSQTGPSLQIGAFGDVRLGAGYDVATLTLNHGADRVSVMTRLDLSLPTGDSRSFAGERGPVTAPSLGAEIRYGIFFASASLGARLREPVEVGGAKLGTQFVSLLGVGVEAISHERLSFALETFLMPSLLSQDHSLPDGTRITNATLVPAEWMASAKTRLGPVAVIFGGGTAIPLSDQTRTPPDGSAETTHFAGLLAPRYRFSLVVRYAPDAGASRSERR